MFGAESLIGRRVGLIELRAVLGEGGAAMVFKGHDLQHRRDVAVKLLKSEWARHSRVRARFEQEAAVLSTLSHPSIPKFYELEPFRGSLAMILELVPGENLEQLLGKDEVLAARRCVPWFIEVLAALHHAHERKVIHRDVKPGNIMVAAETVKILDFGLAKALDNADLTADGTTVGTLLYLAPEQALGRNVDARTDVYSTSVTLYRSVTGAMPFETKTRAEILKAVLSAPAIPPSEQWPLIDPTLEGILLRGLDKNPERRFASARAMQEALQSWLRGVEDAEPRRTR